MKEKFTNQVRLNAPLKHLFEVECRYDTEWKTNFLSLFCTEVHPKEDNRKSICEEMTICLNTKKEAKELIRVIKKAMEKMK